MRRPITKEQKEDLKKLIDQELKNFFDKGGKIQIFEEGFSTATEETFVKKIGRPRSPKR